MKNFIRSASVLATLLCPLLVAGRAQATVVWTAGFESNKSGDVCASTMAGAEFTPAVLDTNGTRINAQVLGEQVYSGKLACKITVHPDDIFTQSYNQNRVDVKHISTLTGEGKDMYLSGHYYLAADAQTRNEFGMFETTNSLNWLDIWIAPKTGGGTSINLGIESNGATLGSVPVWNGDLLPGTWHQIALHVHWSQDATKGSLDFWLDGQQVVTGFKHKTKPNANDLYFLTGLHRVVMQPYTESIYFDDFIEADTQADVKIAAPDQPKSPPDGGADASGADGAGGAAGTGSVSGSAGDGNASGAAGATGIAGSNGAAGSTTTGNAGSTSGAAGSTTGVAGSTSGNGGSITTGTAGRSGGNSGCALAAVPKTLDSATAAFLALLGALVFARRRSHRQR
jgi:hypothetical protein